MGIESFELPNPPAETSSGATSLSTLERVRGKEPEAWRKFVELDSPLIYSWCKRSALKSEDGADVLQVVWRSVVGSVGRFRREAGDGTFRGWLWTITRNKLRDHGRARQRRPEAIGGSEARDRIHEVPDAEPPIPPTTKSGGRWS